MKKKQIIPKIIHQLWIGNKPMPKKLMDTWKTKNPDYEYILWTETEFKKRNIVFECQEAIDRMTEINGKADIMRWELLYNYGGVFIDADSICVEPLDDFFLENEGFAGFENENVRRGLVATGTMGFMKNHPLCKDAIEWIKSNDSCPETCQKRAWATVGPVLLTNLLNSGKYHDFHVYPSYYFLPFHFTGDTYYGHKKVYAFQYWGTTFKNYETMNEVNYAQELKIPDKWVSIVIPSYNTKHIYIVECLESIRMQNGYFGIELIWINDGSTELNTVLLENELDKFMKRTRFCKLKYHKMEKNKGIVECLNKGIEMSSNEIIFRMDSDDIMHPERIKKQLEFMENNKCIICGSNVFLFKNTGNGNEKNVNRMTNHPEILNWNEYKNSGNKSKWFMNHPTLCFKKTAFLAVGKYNETIKDGTEDIDLELRFLKYFGQIYNIKEPLVYYRIHDEQLTNFKTMEEQYQKMEKVQKIIEKITNE